MNRTLLDQLPPRASATLMATLQPGETLLWTGPMNPWRMAVQSLPVFIFGIFWTGFSVFWMAAPHLLSDGEGPPIWFTLFGVPFVLIGLVMLSSPFWSYWQATRSGYAITDQRAIIIECGRASKVIDIPHQDAMPLEVMYHTNSMDIILDKHVGTDSKGRTRTTQIGFFGLRDGKRVETLLREHRQVRV